MIQDFRLVLRHTLRCSIFQFFAIFPWQILSFDIIIGKGNDTGVSFLRYDIALVWGCTTYENKTTADSYIFVKKILNRKSFLIDLITIFLV